MFDSGMSLNMMVDGQTEDAQDEDNLLLLAEVQAEVKAKLL